MNRKEKKRKEKEKKRKEKKRKEKKGREGKQRGREGKERKGKKETHKYLRSFQKTKDEEQPKPQINNFSLPSFPPPSLFQEKSSIVEKGGKRKGISTQPQHNQSFSKETEENKEKIYHSGKENN